MDVDLVRSGWPEQLELEAKYTNKALADEVSAALASGFGSTLNPKT